MTYTPKNRIYAYDHDPIPFDFAQSVERFHVEELPLFAPSGRGEWLILTFRKRDMSTYKLLSVLKSATGASDREIGYAGLKDKNATTLQRISLPRRYEKGLKNLTTERIELLDVTRNHKPLSIGQLRGNAFRIVLTELEPSDLPLFEQAMRSVEDGGVPNYFGYQRFGTDGRSWEQGREIAHSGKRLRGAKERLLVAAWQSRLFNDWLSERLRISKRVETEGRDAAGSLGWPLPLIEELRLFKLFQGEMMAPYPRGRRWNPCRKTADCAGEFAAKRQAPTGLLSGEQVPRALSDARHLEEPYDDREIAGLKGNRRLAWIWPEDLRHNYDEKRASLTLEFTLPPGAYATTLLEEIAKRPLWGAES
ncbi:tRNA pseudouridine(13) synthase TruD [Nitratifractor sp.]